MARRPSRKLSRRQKVVLSVVLSVIGTIAMIGIGIAVQSARDTDLGDSQAGLTDRFQDAAGTPAPPIHFRDVAASMGLVEVHASGPRGRTLPEDTGSGLAWSDFDGDGDPDLYVVGYEPQGGSGPTARLYRNDGARFTDVTLAAGVGNTAGFGMGASFADYDGDNRPDLYVTNRGPNRLYRNRGDGTFEDVSETAAVADAGWSTSACWGDFDLDGHLDLYVCNYVQYDGESAVAEVATDAGSDTGTAKGSYSVPYTLNPNAFDAQPNTLYRNRGDGTFEDVSERCGVANADGRSLAATFCDLDGDGLLDLYVNNDVSSNRLYLGRKAQDDALPRFEDFAAQTGTADPRGSMGLSLAEMGAMGGLADDLPDLFITHWVAQENAFYLSMRSPRGHLEYRDKTRRLRLGENSLDKVGWGSAFLDIDRDGRLDLAVTNGSTLEQQGKSNALRPEPMFLLWNAETYFVDVAQDAGKAAAGMHNGRGLAVADYDADGDLDIAINVNRGVPLLLRNDTVTENHGLVVVLAGPAAKRFGARVRVESAGRTQMQWYGGDVSIFSQHDRALLFGLGAEKRATRVAVRWADGRETVIEDPAAGRAEVSYDG